MQAAINYDELSLDELKVVVASLVERLELAKAALTSKMDTPKLVAAKVEETFPDLPWGCARAQPPLLSCLSVHGALIRLSSRAQPPSTLRWCAPTLRRTCRSGLW